MRRRFSVFIAVLSVLFLYTGLQVGRLAPDLSGPAVWAATVLIYWVLMGWQALYRSSTTAHDAKWFPAVAWSGGVALGLWATYMLLAIPFELGSALHRAVSGGASPSHAAALGLTAAAFGVTAFGLGEVVAGPAVRAVEVPVAGLPDALDGLRIAQLSDLHVGPTVRGPYVERIVRMTMRLAPDLIAVTGDLADGTPAGLAAQVAPLSGLRAPLGVYYVTGNHEYYWDAAGWLAAVAGLGLTPLVNENRLVERGGAGILVGGIPDSSAPHFVAEHRPDAARAAATEGRPSFKLLLAHRPDACDDAEKAGFDLQLSGHTHGGQFFPFSLITRLVHRYHLGLNRHGRLWVYVNAGTGWWGPPHRFTVRAEITALTLRRA